MTGAELISQAIQFYDNTSSADAENANRRLRTLHYGQMVLDEIWNWREWPFKHMSGTVVTASGVGVLPVDFARFGPEGLVWDPSDPTRQWTETLIGDTMALQARGDARGRRGRMFALSAVAGSATVWTGTASIGIGTNSITFDTAIPDGVLFGDQVVFATYPETLLVGTRVDSLTVVTQALATLDHTTEDATITRATSRRAIIIPDPQPHTLSVYYEKVQPTLSDDAVPVPIPEPYHRTVMLAGTVAKMQVSKNDTRIYWEKQYAMGLARMVTNELPLGTRSRQLPMAVGRNNC